MVDQTSFSIKRLIKSILSIAVLGFGGGAAVLPLFHKQFVERYGWLTDDEFQDMLSVSNALPGPIQTKVAGYIGYKLKGFYGMFISLICIILPSLVAMLLFYNTINYYKGEPWVAAAISSVFPVVTVLMLLLTMSYFNKSSKKLKKLTNIVLILLSIITLVILQVNPAVLIIIILISVFLPFRHEYHRFLFMYFFVAIYFLLHYNFFGRIEYNLGVDINDASDLFKVVYAFFIPGILGYGGGPGSLSLISYEIVEHVKLLTSDQFALIVGIQATLPGVTATKLAGAIGYQIAGILGLVLSILIYVTPSIILMIALLNLLNKYKKSPIVIRLTSYVGPVVFVLLGQLTLKFFLSSLDALGWIYAMIFIIVNMIIILKYKLHPFFAIILSMFAGIILSIL